MGIWRESIPGRGHNQCKGPGAGVYCNFKDKEESSVVGKKGVRQEAGRVLKVEIKGQYFAKGNQSTS